MVIVAAPHPCSARPSLRRIGNRRRRRIQSRNLHTRDPLVRESQSLRRPFGKIESAASHIRPAIIYLDDYRFSIFEIEDTRVRSYRQRARGGCKPALVEDFAAASAPAIETRPIP